MLKWLKVSILTSRTLPSGLYLTPKLMINGGKLDVMGDSNEGGLGCLAMDNMGQDAPRAVWYPYVFREWLSLPILRRHQCEARRLSYCHGGCLTYIVFRLRHKVSSKCWSSSSAHVTWGIVWNRDCLHSRWLLLRLKPTFLTFSFRSLFPP